ncbi:MAG: phosphomannomutase/phosphoglucomutase [Patescibacteria group bacterium]
MDFDQIFHAYDIRGVYPDEIDEKKVKRIAMAYASFLRSTANQSLVPSPQSLTVAVGRDVRLSGPKLQKAVIDGLTEAGVDVVDVGAVPTEMLYFAVGYYHFDGGIQVSASHNPKEFNGLKLIKAGVEAISADTGLLEIKKLAQSDDNLSAIDDGHVISQEVEEDYFDYLTKFVHFDAGRPLKVVANANFGLSGLVAQRLLARLNGSHIQLIELNFTPDGNFPKGRPDPLIPANRQETSELIVETKADFGVAWDGDGDRFFVTDEKGQPIEGSHLTALLAEHLLVDHPSEKVIYEPRNIWAVEETVTKAGGVPILNKAGHTFIKNRMRHEDALFAGEKSGHYYFREFYYADNGLIPFLLFLNIVSANQRPASEVILPFRAKYFVSDEINFEVADKETMLKVVTEKYPDGSIDQTDGLSMSFDSWRFNLRASNTENLLRLNIEARDQATCESKTAELTGLINQFKSA